jgi:RNA polymerase sigma-70 factor, ECF subfamily
MILHRSEDAARASRPFLGIPFSQGTNQDGTADNPDVLIRWIDNARTGDLQAFQEIYGSFSRKVMNLIRRMVASIEEAEDLTQETFVAVYQKLGSLKDDTKFEPWLLRIARNHVNQRYRRHTPAMISIDIRDEDGHVTAELRDAHKDPHEACQTEELEEVVRRVIHDLPYRYREVFILAALQDLSYQEVAEFVGRSLSSVKTDIHRARLQVRARVKDYLKIPSESDGSMTPGHDHLRSRFFEN